ncbi:MAG: hypothetical protein E6K12_00010 [Methanobacteriota archaeon]|nr:MAG: hypothetical protein E6K12_00010 [Euryarchaeota archaeon]
MIDVRETIDEIEARSVDEAYWRALERVLGTLTARTLRGTLRVKIQGEGISERDRVARGLTELFSYQARTVEELARKETSEKAPRPRDDTMQELGVHGHWVDFSDAASEARRAMAFVRRGLIRGAKVIALLPSLDLDRYREEAVRAGHQEDIDSGRLSLFNADEHLDVLRTAGVLAVLLLAIQGMIQVARGQGYSEVWFISKIASSLLASSPQYQALALRVDLAMDSLVRTLPISFYCPMPERFPGDPTLVTELLAGHGWGAVAELAFVSHGH